MGPVTPTWTTLLALDYQNQEPPDYSLFDVSTKIVSNTRRFPSYPVLLPL